MSIYLATFGKLRYLGLADIPDPAVSETRWILIKTVRGLEMGLVGGALSQEQEAKYRASCLEDNSGEQTRGPEPMLQEVEYVRNADAEQIEAYYQCRSDEDAALVRGREILAGHDLTMKLVDVEYLMDRKKLFFYFTSEQRVDFRGYVRDLAKEFRTRIEMRQIGVRDEARVVRGIAPCGRPCCCSYWLHRFTPICIRMVKEQNLALNPTKISGICGRLMCCMAYEHPLYSALWRSLPSPGSKIKTENGNYVLESVDLGAESVRVRFPSGHVVPVSIAEFADFKDAVLQGRDWGDEPAAPAPRFAGGARRKNPLERKAPGAERPELRAKPEKISLDEHLAGMAGRESGRADGALGDRAASGRPEHRAAGLERHEPQEGGERSGASKKRRRRKSGGAVRGDAPAEQALELSRLEGTEPGNGPRPYRPVRPRPDRPEADREPAQGGERREEGRRRPRPRRRPDGRDRGPQERRDGGDMGKGEA